MHKRTVLIADNQDSMRKSLRSLFESQGWIVLEAKGGDEAVEVYNNFSPDLVTLDIAMKYGDGFMATRAIKKINSAANIIIITETKDKSMLTRIINAGVRGILLKPLDVEKMNQLIARIFPE
ncbi:MAG: response regulator [Spirochaetes bacterium]|nr:response regulator [Spirochaetota bacterium]